jgi:L-threonylcarbamoyladenylate synthase
MKMWDQISEAVKQLARGNLVALPTETVYGLAASIDHPDGILKIFETKERPFFDPLIVHIGRPEQLKDLVEEVPVAARILAEEFWPGPLTLVLKKSSRISDQISSGLDSVGVRLPNHSVTRRILRQLKIPVAAPSANRFGRTSPTEAHHVREEFPGHSFLIVEGGQSHRGIESTVVRPTPDRIEILRPGPISDHEIRRVLLEKSLEIPVVFLESSASPGHTPHHYQPEIPLVWSPTPTLSADDLGGIARNLHLKSSTYKCLELPSEAHLAARLLYQELRRLSKEPIDFILFCPPARLTGDWRAIFDRLQRASSLQL